MKKTFIKIFTDKRLPFIELRYSNSNTHYKEHFLTKVTFIKTF